ncbi:transcriptional regulator, PadR family [Geomicrobium sp. JCM 19037]|uniref:PadR family transcriptional regulator n=1 Tax=Geomicrobium sp. JCM 19037 TaxID=1460634 RepID=UPI00045F2982|nr:PadR family transcriptional regulator [Geomicrobium sp. JCM 19037]GAK04564.1 transcriptional regulator, PadR family [Geomicrobium sp. JCM 19037]
MSVQLFILGQLMESDTYPYELKKKLSEPIPLDRFGGITESKLYYHFESLEKKGYVARTEVVKEENRPDKQLFRITEQGRHSLPKQIYSLFEKSEDIQGMIVGLANLHHVDTDQVIAILQKKIDKINTDWQEITQYRNHPIDSVEELRLFLDSYLVSDHEHKIAWLENLIHWLKTGGYPNE